MKVIYSSQNEGYPKLKLITENETYLAESTNIRNDKMGQSLRMNRNSRDELEGQTHFDYKFLLKDYFDILKPGKYDLILSLPKEISALYAREYGKDFNNSSPKFSFEILDEHPELEAFNQDIKFDLNESEIKRWGPTVSFKKVKLLNNSPKDIFFTAYSSTWKEGESTVAIVGFEKWNAKTFWSAVPSGGYCGTGIQTFKLPSGKSVELSDISLAGGGIYRLKLGYYLGNKESKNFKNVYSDFVTINYLKNK